MLTCNAGWLFFCTDTNSRSFVNLCWLRHRLLDACYNTPASPLLCHLGILLTANWYEAMIKVARNTLHQRFFVYRRTPHLIPISYRILALLSFARGIIRLALRTSLRSFSASLIKVDLPGIIPSKLSKIHSLIFESNLVLHFVIKSFLTYKTTFHILHLTKRKVLSKSIHGYETQQQAIGY
jgi:hypothetical protein